jgi:hypothetical protein
MQPMDVGDNDINSFEVGSIRGGSSDFDRFGVTLARQHAAQTAGSKTSPKISST